MRRSMQSQRGFTLIELTVALLITGIISIALVEMLQVGQRSSERNKILVEMQQNARVGLESLANDLRHVSWGKDPSQPSIHYATYDSVSFSADLLPDHPGGERINFFLSPDGDPDTENPNDTVLMKVVTDTLGTVLFSAPQSYGIAQSGLQFRWFNGSGVELPSPVSQPEQVGEIFVSLTAAADRQIGGIYPDLTLTQTIYPRNLPLSPARSRPSPPGCDALAFPNCESATITWTTPTTNTDGTELLLTDISHFTIYLGLALDEQSVYTKVARTINQWTIAGLEGGSTYYVSVSCTSRSGVESSKCTQVADMTSSNVPRPVAMLAAIPVMGGGLRLVWPAVTQFVGGSAITTAVTYRIYRDETPGFTPSEANLLETVVGATQIVDTTMVNCTTSYYRVTAAACGNEGDPSPQAQGYHPAPPYSPSDLTGLPTASPGELLLYWTPPSMRVDGSPLDPADIQAYRVYADTLPGTHVFHTELSGDLTSATITGLLPCRAYWVNLQCVDQCGHMGYLNPSNEIAVFTSSPCNPETPAAPYACAVTPGDNRVAIEWPANQYDCDLSGYKIYYGNTPGGPYNGSGAAQGPSPIRVAAASVTTGSQCRFDLTGLESCEHIYARITAVDLCEPPNESGQSPESGDVTTCIPCETDACCVAWAVDPAGYTDLHLEVFTQNAGGESITQITPEFSAEALIREVWYGRPLAKIWSYDGSAGEDGPGQPRGSGTVLNVDDFTVPSWTSRQDGEPLMVVFTNDVRDVPVSLSFRGYSGNCTASGTGRAAALIDDFDDGDYNGWDTVTNPPGLWSVSGGELSQGSTSNTYVLASTGGTLSDCTYEAKMKILPGGTVRAAYLVFRLQSWKNYYLCGLDSGNNQVCVARVLNGSYSIPDGGRVDYPISEDTWYTLRMVTSGGNVKVYVNCALVLQFDTLFQWPSGRLGVSTHRTLAQFDDVKMFSGPVLP